MQITDLMFTRGKNTTPNKMFKTNEDNSFSLHNNGFEYKKCNDVKSARILLYNFE